MNLPDGIRIYLQQQQFPYRLIPCLPNETLAQTAERLDISVRRVLRCVLLKDADGLVMAILPYSHMLDFPTLRQLSQRELEPLDSAEAIQFFQAHDCKSDSRPPLPAAFGIPALVDISLEANEDGEVYFESGNADALLGMQATHFHKLLVHTRWAQFAIPVENLDLLISQQALTPHNLTSLANRYTPAQLRTGSESSGELPAVPQTVRDILELRANPNTCTQDIIQLAERNPGLAALVVHWTRAPLHHYHDDHGGEIDSLEAAIQKVLGIENTLDLLLGFSMSQAFRIPAGGPVGLRAVWRHGVYCAALVGELVKLLPDPTGIKPGLAYLCGLLHNFGYLVLGHVLPARFFLLNRFLAVNRHIPFNAVERYVMGTEHWQIGAWLMRSWHLPEEVIAAAHWHHSENSTEPYSEYANLVLISNRLLHYVGFGEEYSNHLPMLALFTLNITPDQAMSAVQQVHLSMAELDSLCEMLAVSEET